MIKINYYWVVWMFRIWIQYDINKYGSNKYLRTQHKKRNECIMNKTVVPNDSIQKIKFNWVTECYICFNVRV